MSTNTEGFPIISREEFCVALRAARERAGITLDAIAEVTKIPASRFAALERNDLRAWPKGIFRRAYFREYAVRIGLPVDEVCAQFARLFPDEDTAASPASPVAATVVKQAEPPSEVRLVLDRAWHGPRSSIAWRLLAATIDAVTVMAVAIAITLAAGVDPRPTIAIVTLLYFSLATALLGESPAKWAMTHLQQLAEGLPRLSEHVAELRQRAAGVMSRVSDAASRLYKRPDVPAPPPADEPASRTWVTDARRVGSPKLRVRFKPRNSAGSVTGSAPSRRRTPPGARR